MTTPGPVTIPGLPVVAEQWPNGGPPVVFLHAGICDRRSWQGTVAQLAGRAHLVTYDRRGYGDSPPSSVPFTHVDDLLALLDAAAGDEPAWLVGSSMGGQVAIDAALMYPRRCRGLCLIAPAVSGAPGPGELDADTAHLSDLLDAAVASADMNEIARLDTWLWLDGPAGPEGRVGGAARDLVQTMDTVVLRNAVDETAGASPVEAWPQLESLDLPVSVLWGELEVPFFAEQCARLAERVPHATSHVLPAMAHLPYLEDPALVAELIAEAITHY